MPERQRGPPRVQGVRQVAAGGCGQHRTGVWSPEEVRRVCQSHPAQKVDQVHNPDIILRGHTLYSTFQRHFIITATIIRYRINHTSSTTHLMICKTMNIMNIYGLFLFF